MYEKFEELLNKYHVTAYRVAKETGVTTATLTSWKQGKYTPKREKLQKIADYFGVTVEYFTGEEKKIISSPLTMYEAFNKLLLKNNITPYKVSKETGVSQSTLSDWKRGISTPKPDKLQKIADYFGVPLTYFLLESANASDTEKSQDLTAKDERDIARDMENIRSKLLSGSDGPLSYDGEPIPEEDAELLLGQIELMMRRLKHINKEKYNPNKNKK